MGHPPLNASVMMRTTTTSRANAAATKRIGPSSLVSLGVLPPLPSPQIPQHLGVLRGGGALYPPFPEPPLHGPPPEIWMV